jgi:two-component system cell cycle sensor histidine kinase/response regulator CckA
MEPGRSLEAQREAELRFRRLFESSIVGVMVSLSNGRVLEANDTVLEMLGYTREELAAGVVNWRELTPAEWHWQNALAGEEMRLHGSTRAFEKEYFHKDGTRIPILVGIATLDADRVISIVTDLTASKRAEERKVAVVDTALDAVVGMDHAGIVTEFNPAAERTFGYTRAEAVGHSLAELMIPPRLRAAYTHALERNLGTGDAQIIGKRIEMSAVRRDGIEIPVELAVSRVGSGPTPSFVGFIRDISERKRVEHALVEQVAVAALGADIGSALVTGETLGEVLQHCCEAVVRRLGAAFARIWTLNAATNVLELQASAGQYTHIDGPHARVPVGMFKIGLIAEERRPHLTNAVQTDPRVGDHAWASREGMQSFAGHPLIVDGQLMGVMAMFARTALTDVALTALASIADAIAVRIRVWLADQANAVLEDQLRQSHKMEAVGRLAGGIAHDFNNLLSVVLGRSEMVIRELREGDPIRADVEEIRRAGERASELTRQLLTFSRRQVIETRVLDLDEMLTAMDRMLRRLVGENVELISASSPGLWSIRADPGSIDQVFMNLAINARDAMPGGGKLRMETANVVLDDDYARGHLGAKAGSYVMLAVTDTGVGMDRETQARMFEPFFTTKPTGQGTGLGLSTVFGIVQQSGGYITAYSEPGVGTTFKVYLPRVDGIAEEAHPVKPSTTPRGTETILLVEDEDQVRDVARGILTRHGYTVIAARNAGEALLQCEQAGQSIDLLLTDVVMPQMGGLELATRLLALRPDLKVLYMSGYTDDASLRDLVDGELAYLQKPLTVATLTRKVRMVLDARRSIRIKRATDGGATLRRVIS